MNTNTITLTGLIEATAAIKNAESVIRIRTEEAVAQEKARYCSLIGELEAKRAELLKMDAALVTQRENLQYEQMIFEAKVEGFEYILHDEVAATTSKKMAELDKREQQIKENEERSKSRIASQANMQQAEYNRKMAEVMELQDKVNEQYERQMTQIRQATADQKFKLRAEAIPYLVREQFEQTRKIVDQAMQQLSAMGMPDNLRKYVDELNTVRIKLDSGIEGME